MRFNEQVVYNFGAILWSNMIVWLEETCDLEKISNKFQEAM